ncbi:ABC transporter ATP-binding protein [Aliarcobacter cryaerophilus]|uniref:ABC transporter ATP-binding protein n=1 Tax=Aliarcobacter cryaerophilus TaxID=28198 RepID=UPI0021B1E8AD|nr:ABC transporter ATP-binding protein [Aliarcobacter cryaerophilus]MCT7480392.1 ABC transporter ATP-binding protein [Aliarcobacter cryaerophilus]MCT7484728.1 ABC transporter ATP-binding protein [Aliarcobacter cryaerophilus]MCT7544394.1 ABC transporter ATP-binding protein [Aliarcobacter cryaerophilus]
MYKIENLNFEIQKKEILKNISLSIKNNNFLSIVGPNGCGKSTLIKTINRNIDIQSGKISLDDKNIEEFSDKDLALRRSVLNQSFSFPYSFKAIEIVEMGLYAYLLNTKEKKDILDYVVEKLHLNSLKDKNYLVLSGGEKQKIQFARVVVQIVASKQKERYLFLDEPTLNLDIFYQYKILDLAKELQKDLNIGVCAILHDINQAYLYSDEIVMMKNGHIKYFGATKDILTYENIYDVFEVKSEFVYSKNLQKDILITTS